MLPPPLIGSGLDLQGQTQILPPPSLKTFFEARVEETGDTLEIKDSEDHGGTSLFLLFVRKPELYCFYVEPSEVTFTSKERSVQWLDYLPSPALSIYASNRFASVAVINQCVSDRKKVGAYAQSGMSGVCHDDGVALSYDFSHLAWVTVCTGWWAASSSLYSHPSPSDNPCRSVISSIETHILSDINTSGRYEGEAGGNAPCVVSSGGYLEVKMHAAEILVSVSV